MELKLTAAEEAFRAEIRAFFRENLPADLVERCKRGFYPTSKADRVTINKVLDRKGWAVPHWPVEYGGVDWTPMQHHIFEEEMYKADAPQVSWAGARLVAPVIYTFGTDAQKARHLPPIRNGDALWAQGFSEPGAGSDLASLKTRAERKGDKYIVNGQKIWTSEAQHASWGFFVVRTDPSVKPQAGLSFLLIDMTSPGVTVRPIIMIEGGHYVNEVFLENVEVPVENLVGEENKGWSYTKFLLGNERTSSAEIYWSKRELEKAREIASHEMVGGRRLIDTPEFARKFAKVEIELMALEWSVIRALCEAPSRYPVDAVASNLKVRGSELQQRVTELQMEALGLHSTRFFTAFDADLDDPAQADLWPGFVPGRVGVHLHGRAFTIYGGAREVQKNIIAKLVFGF